MITTPEDGETGGAGSALRCPPSKLRPPRPHVQLVARDAVVEKLLQSSEPLVVVSAPAGSGKTVLLTQWLGAENSPGAWLRLDGNDNDPLVLLRGLAVALDQVLGIDPEILELLQLRQSSAGRAGPAGARDGRGRLATVRDGAGRRATRAERGRVGTRRARARKPARRRTAGRRVTERPAAAARQPEGKRRAPGGSLRRARVRPRRSAGAAPTSRGRGRWQEDGGP